jgi:hypothetical protein
VDSLARYYGVHDELLLVPIEELSPRGMSPAHRKRLEETGRLPVGWVELFDRAFSLYWERAGELATRAPRYWFPPRLQHVCVCTAPGRIRPYFQPINRSSWLVELSDFDPENSNEEFATYQLFHAERMGLLKEVSGAVVLNLSYWLVRSGEEIARFQEACRNVPRSDANAFRALADALAWIPQCHHETLRPLRILTPEKPLEVPRSGLLLPRRLEPDFRALLREWTDRPKEVMAVFYRTYAARDPLALRAFRSWLEGEAPRLLVTVGDDRRSIEAVSGIAPEPGCAPGRRSPNGAVGALLRPRRTRPHRVQPGRTGDGAPPRPGSPVRTLHARGTHDPRVGSPGRRRGMGPVERGRARP